MLTKYQSQKCKEAQDIFNKHNFVLINGQMRTGKTFTGIVLAWVSGFKNALFITKKKSISSIKDNLSIIREHKKYDDLNVDIINYESLHKADHSKYDVIIADEYHNLGYIQKQTGKSRLFWTTVGRKPIIALTGTVFTETFSTAFSLFPFEFNEFSNFYRWYDKYGLLRYKYFNGMQIRDYSYCNIDGIMGCISKYIVSMDQINAGFVGKVQDRAWEIPLDHNQNEMINRVRKDKALEEYNYLVDSAAKEAQAVAQIQSGTLKLGEDKHITVSLRKCHFISSQWVSKGIKVAVFYKYVGEKKLLENYFDNITEDPNEFQNNDKFIFIGQYRSCMEGIKLDTADDIVFYTMPWSNLEYLQSRERIMSSTKKKATCHLLISGYEDKVYKVVTQSKKKFNTRMYKEISADVASV